MNSFIRKIKDVVEGTVVVGAREVSVKEDHSPNGPVAVAYFKVPVATGAQQYAVAAIIPEMKYQTATSANLYANEFIGAMQRKVDILLTGKL